MTEIKICGIKTEEEVHLINGYPLQYIGFIFAKSKRQVSIEKAQALRKLVREDIQVVGVFMDQPVDYILEATRKCGLNKVQLHGSEDEKIIQKIPVPVWKSIGVKGEDSMALLEDYPSAEGLLLDTYHKGATGGTGKAFNWDLVKDLKLKQKFILAGGLSPENALEAIETVGPNVLDLNSGLETDLMKDPVKVAALFDVLGGKDE